MDQYEFIRTAHRAYGMNISELARTTGHSRNTVKKALRGEPWGYKERRQQPFPSLGPYLETIDGWLKADKEQPKKQRHTARRVYDRLVAESGYTGGESTVRHYVRMAKIVLGIDAPQAFIPCDPEVGREAEVDWGTAEAVIAGERLRLKFFCMRSKYSGKHFVRFYPCERQQAFFDAHIHAFAFFGGVFPVLIYDNLTAAVRKVLQGKGRVEQEAFRGFKAYYSFEARFCNPDQGHEKGGVEGLVGFARRNYMVPLPQAESLEELNEKVLAQCVAYGERKPAGRERRVREMFEEEKWRLLQLPVAAFSNIQAREGRADKYATLTADKNRYSVPSRYTGFRLRVLMYVERVDIFYRQQKLASHRRLYGNNKWSLDPDHYLELIQRRPMAFHSARPIRQWQKSWPASLDLLLERFCHCQGQSGGVKDFISLLMLYREYKAADLEAAVLLALENHISQSSGVRCILDYTMGDSPGFAPLSGWPSLPEPDVTVYGQLGGVA
jgi:transposase